LISLYDDNLIRLTGSSGGLFSKDLFYDWKKYVPFNYKNKTECKLRLLISNTKSMKKRHISYVGKDDPLIKNINKAKKELTVTKAPLDVVIIEGDHFTSLNLAIQGFLSHIMKDE